MKAIFRFLTFYRRVPKPGPVGQMRAPALSGVSHAQIAQFWRIWKMRSSFDFAPYRRSTVGFDRLFDLLETDLRGDAGESYPPFDLSRQGEDSYRITLAVAGFRPGDIEVVAQQNQLIISGKRGEDNDEGQYLHRGIAARAFERRFQLADYVEVASADFDNGLLKIDLRRVVPEAMKPRKIEIGGSSPANDRLEAPKKKDLEAA
ncbi:molecular chaperone IbpA [Sphingopyxis sp. OAS728]|nr:molecular chaperone IbpA [Sphingopyxis sp. OAS728]